MPTNFHSCVKNLHINGHKIDVWLMKMGSHFRSKYTMTSLAEKQKRYICHDQYTTVFSLYCTVLYWAVAFLYSKYNITFYYQSRHGTLSHVPQIHNESANMQPESHSEQ